MIADDNIERVILETRPELPVLLPQHLPHTELQSFRHLPMRVVGREPTHVYLLHTLLRVRVIYLEEFLEVVDRFREEVVPRLLCHEVLP